MHISTKGRIAVNALIDVAQHQGGGPVALATVSRRQRVSLSYLEQLFSRLRRDGIVHSTRGPGGGYTLAREGGDITVAAIVAAVEDPADAAELAADGASRALWQRLNEQLLQIMAAVTLQQLLDEQPAAVEPGARSPRAVPAPRRAAPAAVLPRPLKPTVPNSVFALGLSFAR